ncbi:hypothetical protein AVEN_59464-1 [Araneus ventricosus]|uniref:Peptidase A9 domain-containing protein n=1 Tax=Araneus ventricosus TaxID=182803 RepID=A0A4Y2N4R8_ARAVE|nr:hypothetical protein AVEN_59464-1 [Araneus ventricosus]
MRNFSESRAIGLGSGLEGPGNFAILGDDDVPRNQVFQVDRPERINLIVRGGEEFQEHETEELVIPYPVSEPNIYDFERIKGDSELEGRLSSTEIESLKQLLGRHQKVFSNNPGKTHLVEHDFEFISNKPIRSKPYRASQRQNEILKSEIKRMLELNIIEIG